ncbi:MAG: hypothetical protein DDT24_00847 [Chloroflexi bacterium]|nr:hypothetical protein [Chloroflexota bacterium]
MDEKLKAVYCEGTFVPREPCDIPEGAEVELIIEGSAVLPPEVTEPAKQARILKTMVERMQKNPIPPGAPYLTREELHERC